MNQISDHRKPDFSVEGFSDKIVVIRDRDAGGVTVTNAPQSVLDDLNARLPGGLGERRVIYCDTIDRYDIIEYGAQGQFMKFGPGTGADHEWVRKCVQGIEEAGDDAHPV